MTLSRTRRNFLRAMGAGFAALPFSRLLENSVAQAAGEALPLRFIGMYTPHGVAAEFWAMKSSDTETKFDVAYDGCSLQPFDDAATYGKSFKDKILVVEGIDHMSNAGAHDSAGTIFTGSTILNDTKKPQNSSLDQYLAVTKGLGSATRITSVALGVGTDSIDSGTTLSYGEGGVPLPKVIDPVAAFHLLFDGVAAGGDPAAAAAAAQRAKLGQSIIDYERWDITRLRAKLAPLEQAKLDQHLTSLRELEKQFSGTGTGSACTVPTMPDATTFPKLKQYNGGEPYFDAITKAHIDLLAQAIACDLTRFATLFTADLSYADNPLHLPADNHGGVAHPYLASRVGNNGHANMRTVNGTQVDGDPDTWATLAKFNRYSMGNVARLMQKLDAFGVLDNTLIYVSSDMGNPALHSTRNVPTLLAGGLGGKFRMGRRLNVGADCPASNEWCDTPVINTVTNNKILVAIAQAFGADVNTFGTQPDPALTSGALSNLT